MPPRQAVNHPYLVIYSPSASNAVEQAQAVLDAKAAAGLCVICHDPFEVHFFPRASHRQDCWHVSSILCAGHKKSAYQGDHVLGDSHAGFTHFQGIINLTELDQNI